MRKCYFNDKVAKRKFSLVVLQHILQQRTCLEEQPFLSLLS